MDGTTCILVLLVINTIDSLPKKVSEYPKGSRTETSCKMSRHLYFIN